MRSKWAESLLAPSLLVALCATSSAQGIHPNQARADADLYRQRAESLAVQRKNEQTEKDERAQFEARKKGYEKDERRKEEQQKREALAQERAMQQFAQGEKRNLR